LIDPAGIMAENPPANAAVDGAADSVAKLHLDEVTGEMISKSELKKRQKNRQKDAEKKEKAEKLAASGAPAPKPKSTEDSEKDLTPNQVFLRFFDAV
jgi:lysyl-tRNA synthetase class 2